MSTYRFLGIDHLIGGERLQEYGATIELSDEDAASHVLGSCPLIPESDWQALGITDAEQERYSYPGPRNSAPTEFLAKMKAGRDALHAFRESLKKGA